MQIIALALVFVGIIFATAEVGVVSLTKELGRAGAASPIVAVYALGSFLVGLILGGMQVRAPLHSQLHIALAVVALTQVPLLFVGSVTTLGLAIFISGIAVSPTFITAFGLVAQRVPPAMLTEGVTWVFTAIGVGMALGALLAGAVIDHWGARSGFALSVLGGIAALLVVTLGRARLASTPDDCR